MWKPKKRNPKTMRLGSFEVASRFQMGFANLQHTEERQHHKGVSNIKEINKRIMRKLFPKPKISTVLQELEDFTYAMALDLNMGYIPLDWIQMHPKYVPLS
jgi:hypothetical protein